MKAEIKEGRLPYEDHLQPYLIARGITDDHLYEMLGWINDNKKTYYKWIQDNDPNDIFHEKEEDSFLVMIVVGGTEGILRKAMSGYKNF